MGLHRMFKAAVVLITLGYCSILVYHTAFHFNAFNYLGRRSDPVQVLVLDPFTTANDSDSVQKKNITLDDIFISVKTSRHYEKKRLQVILKTWYQLAKNQTWFFTDTTNPNHQRFTNGHMVNTNCSDTHQRQHLCCKTSVEYDFFIESGKKWFCHFDDDNYVNVPRLVEVLRRYDHRQDWYLGRNSVPRPVNILLNRISEEKSSGSFWFATFGAGMCLSRSLALKIVPFAGGGKFISICEKIRFPDDVTMGYIIKHLAKQKLTVLTEFHSHLEQMKLMPSETFKEQISFSYSDSNVLEVPGFDLNYDPTRFLSLHCFLFPHFEFCPR